MVREGIVHYSGEGYAHARQREYDVAALYTSSQKAEKGLQLGPNLPQHHPQLGIKCSNTWAGVDTAELNHHKGPGRDSASVLSWLSAWRTSAKWNVLSTIGSDVVSKGFRSPSITLHPSFGIRCYLNDYWHFKISYGKGGSRVSLDGG